MNKLVRKANNVVPKMQKLCIASHRHLSRESARFRGVNGAIMKWALKSFVVVLANVIFCCWDLAVFVPFAGAQNQDAPPPSIAEMMAQVATARQVYAARPNGQQVDSISLPRLKDALIGKMSDKGWRLTKEEEHLLRLDRAVGEYEDSPIVSTEILMYPRDAGVNVKFSFFGDRKAIHDSDIVSAKIDILQSLEDISRSVVKKNSGQ